MTDERITSFIAPSAFDELQKAKALLKDINSDPVVRLKTICDSIANVCGSVHDHVGTLLDQQTFVEYNDFARQAIAKAKELL